MVDAGDFTVTLADKDGKQIVSTKIQLDGVQTELLYARPKGRDTWFNFIGYGQSVTDASVSDGVPNEIREASDAAVLAEGYPIRTIDGDQSKSGEINLFFGGIHHVHSFITHPDSFYVFQDDSSAHPGGEPDSNQVYIRIVNEDNDKINVAVNTKKEKPNNFVIEEAVLFKWGSENGWKNLPNVNIES